MPGLTVVVVTPESTVLDEKTDFVALPLYDGEIGIAGGHSPMIGRLGFGEMRIKTGGNIQRFYLDGGFVQVANDIVSVMTNRAVVTSELDRAKAEKQLEDAMKRPANSDELLEVRDRAVTQARAQIRTASRA